MRNPYRQVSGRTAGRRPAGARAARSPREWFFWVGPPVLLMGFIYWIGSDQGSFHNTEGLLRQVLGFLWPSASPETLTAVNALVRKLGHVTGYALLAGLNARAARGLCGALGRREATLAWGAAVTWAAVDELHQSLFASRSGVASDVLLDAFGALIGVGIYHAWTSRTLPRS